MRMLLLQVLELLLERKAAETRHARELSIRDAELARMQQYIDDELTELHQRQAQVGTQLKVALSIQFPYNLASFTNLSGAVAAYEKALYFIMAHADRVPPMMDDMQCGFDWGV